MRVTSDLEVKEGEEEDGIWACSVCSTCVLVSGGLRFPSRVMRPFLLPTQSWYQVLSYHIPLTQKKKTPHTHTQDHHHLVAGDWRRGWGGHTEPKRIWWPVMDGWGDVKVVRGQPGAATICGYIFSPEPLNVRLALGLSAAFWCG